MVKRDHIEVIVKVRVNRARDYHELFVICIFAVLCHVLISVLGEIAGMGFLSVDNEHGASYLVAVLEDRLINK